MTQTTAYHNPVLLKESIDGLQINPNGIYVDCTFGGGGHSKEILKNLDNGRLLAFDKDEDAQNNSIEDERFMLIHHDFIFMKNFLKQADALPVDGILADLGVSSHQFDVDERGFSFKKDADLDMRMDRDIESSAKEVVNTYSESDLHKIFGIYGELKNAKTIAREIASKRAEKQIETTIELAEIIKSCLRKTDDVNKFLTLAFQALRIEVNEELEALKSLLQTGVELLKPNGRFAIITYHSLEDRLVKNFFKSGNFRGQAEKDFYGNMKSPFRLVNKKPIVPNENELEQNPRSRSAKLRIAEKI
jgi:16S rRNA (cytosine1402-N4)-methyltransferase